MSTDPSPARPKGLDASRRRLLQGAARTGTGVLLGSQLGSVLAEGIAPAVITSERLRPQVPGGVMSGDVTDDGAIVWSRTDRPARLWVEASTHPRFVHARRWIGAPTRDGQGYTTRVDLTGLPPGADVYYRVRFQSLQHESAFSEPVYGHFRTAPRHGREPLCFVFAGDEAGQGWGINESFGGYRLYDAMRRESPDFFIHSGDQIYADGPISAEVQLPDGSTWTNLVTEAKSHVAQTLDDYRGNFAYNQLDRHKRRFAAEVPFLVQWDDHEVRNNWFPGQQIGAADARYTTERDVSTLARYARQALFEFNPIRPNLSDPEQIYRSFSFGPLLEVFMLDERSYRGANSPNRQTQEGGEAAFLGAPQLRWLKEALRNSCATWKVIASDMPISLVVPDGNPDVPKGTYEAWANADDGAPAGRELELASLLRFIKRHDIENIVWVTADVHYAQATHYDPSRARFTDFKPFWEFVGGPIHAGTFGPNGLDTTFGPEVRYVSVPADNPQNRAPSAGQQFFGCARIDPRTRQMCVALKNLDGRTLWQVTLDPQR